MGHIVPVLIFNIFLQAAFCSFVCQNLFVIRIPIYMNVSNFLSILDTVLLIVRDLSYQDSVTCSENYM